MTSTDSSARFCSKCGAETTAARCPHDGAPTFARRGSGTSALKLLGGTVIDGKYRVAEQLGRGGFGAVYAAEHLTTGQQVAIKVLAVDPDDDDDTMLARFLQEAQVTARLKHPNTVRVFDFGQTDDGALYMVLELLRGPTLDRVLKDHEKAGTTMTEKAALGLAVPILRSLQEAHDAGLVHRDLKPANVILADAGDDEPVVKVLDFGIARKSGSDLTGTGKALGTPSYMSPEQCRGLQLDGRSDLYPVGLILYRCVAGRLPFQGDNPLALIHAHVNDAPPDLRSLARTQVSDGFVALVHRALAKAPGDRFASAREMRDECQALLGGAWAGTPVRALPVAAEPQSHTDDATLTVAATGAAAPTVAPETPQRVRVAVETASDVSRTIEALPMRSEARSTRGPWLLAAIALVAVVAVMTWWRGTAQGRCGDGRCDHGETTASCASDCPTPPPGATAPTSVAAPVPHPAALAPPPPAVVPPPAPSRPKVEPVPAVAAQPPPAAATGVPAAQDKADRSTTPAKPKPGRRSGKETTHERLEIE